MQDQIQSANQQIKDKDQTISALQTQFDNEATKTAQQQQTISALEAQIKPKEVTPTPLPERYLKVIKVRNGQLVPLQSNRHPVPVNEEVRIKLVMEDVDHQPDPT